MDPSASGQLWLSNGHYIGDGSTADDDADTGASGGPGEKKSPPGRPLAACAGTTDPCTARTGLVIQRYESSFDAGARTPPFDVRWVWSVVGAPPGATISVRPIDGKTLEAGGWGVSMAPIALVVLVGGGLSALLAVRWVRRKTRPAGTEPAEHPGGESAGR